jgi:hypothetical protein
MTPEQSSAALRSAFYTITAAARDTAERCNRLSIDAGNNWRDAYLALEDAMALEDAYDSDEYMAAAARACGRAIAAAEKSASEWGEVYTALISAYEAAEKAAMRSAKKPGRKNAAGF